MHYLLIIIILTWSLFGFGQQADKGANAETMDNGEIHQAFQKADSFMETDNYDSAQLWLDKINLKISYRKPSLFSYFISSRQAEVYYYNNLHQLGLLEAIKAENMAKALKDSLLISDACNFIGLFYLNNNKVKHAINYFKKGLSYSSQPPYKKDYLELSKPHHMYGNLAEAFEKLRLPDSAIFYSQQSLQKASEINSERGIATAGLSLANAYLLKSALSKAVYYFELSKKNAGKSRDFDVELNSYGGLASCWAIKGNRALALNNLVSGFALLKKYPQLNELYTSVFLETAINIYRKYNEKELLIKTLGFKSATQTSNHNRNNVQIQSILKIGLENEKRISSLEIIKSRNKQSLANTRLYIILLVFLLVVIAFIAYRYYVLQKLKLADLRNEISQDLHDEVGATLSGIAMYSYITKEQVINHQQEDILHSLDVINDNAGQMVAKLSDIVWAVNPVADNLNALVQRLKDFTLQLTAIKNIELEFNFGESPQDLRLLMEQRKNIYLICKEAINNAVKYSECNRLIVEISTMKKLIRIFIKDNGKGFCYESIRKGNGLINMVKRANEIKAELAIDGQTGKGTCISLTLKIT